MPTARQLALGVLFVSGTVFAQPAAPPAQPPAPPQQDPAAGQPGGQAPGAVDMRIQQRPTLSPSEMVTQATEYKKRMEDVAKRIQVLIEEARKQKDIIRINCLTDKLVQVKAHQNIADRSAQAMQDSSARNDRDGAFHEFTRVTIVNQNVQVLGGEAEACVGEDLSYVGATRVDVDTEGVPPGDPTQPTPPAGPEIVRPPSASPFI
jgi:hypothetical protein